jgi:ribosomal protein S18 acetylase RimI-like enzyme
MSAAIAIREMQMTDLQGVYDVQKQSFKESFWEPIEMFQKILEAYPQGCFVAEKAGKIVAYAVSQPTDESREDFDSGYWEITGGEDCLYFHDLCLLPEARGQGIAQTLFSSVLDHARENGFKKMIGISVQETEAFWIKMGFEMGHGYQYLEQSGTFMSLPLKDKI